MGRQLGWVWFGGMRASIYCIPWFTNRFGIIDAADNLTVKILNPGLTSVLWRTAAAINGKVYCIPFSSNQFGVIDTRTNDLVLSSLGSQPGSYDWQTSCVVGKKIYCIPYLTDFRPSSNLIGVIDTELNSVSISSFGLSPGIIYSWTTAQSVLSKVFCIPYLPYAGNNFGIIDADSNTLTLTALGLDPDITYGWYGSAVVGTKIYCIPWLNSSGNLYGIIDGESSSITFMNIDDAPNGSAYTNGWGTFAASGTKIYCIPSRNDTIFNNFGIINTESNTLTITNLGVAERVGAYEWLSSVVHDNKIYCIPYRGDVFGIIDTESDTLTLETFGTTPSINYTWGTSAAVLPLL
jgi:hypothetical protein